MSAGRYHLLSLAAAGLALALGLGLGAGPVAEGSADDAAERTDRLRQQVGRLEERVAAQDVRSAADAAALEEMGAPLTDGALEGRSVVVVATPGARDHDVERVRVALEDAGATVTGALWLTRTYVDPAQAESPLEDLALRLVPPGVEFPDGATSIERVGTVLARATVQRPDDAEQPTEPDGTDPGPVDQAGAKLIAGLDELGALRLDGEPGLLAELAVVVAGADEGDAAVRALAGLLAALDAGSRGAVLAGPGPADTGLLRAVRDDGTEDLAGVSTVDSADGTAGAVALVLALAEQADDGAGDYGTGRGAPRVLPAPADGG